MYSYIDIYIQIYAHIYIAITEDDDNSQNKVKDPISIIVFTPLLSLKYNY